MLKECTEKQEACRQRAEETLMDIAKRKDMESMPKVSDVNSE